MPAPLGPLGRPATGSMLGTWSVAPVPGCAGSGPCSTRWHPGDRPAARVWWTPGTTDAGPLGRFAARSTSRAVAAAAASVGDWSSALIPKQRSPVARPAAAAAAVAAAAAAAG